MIIIFLSGGSGKRLWPLSNNVRSKQFLKLLDAPDGTKESMIQRNVRILKESRISSDFIFATSSDQRDLITSQTSQYQTIVTEPSRRDTFPAIALACAYLSSEIKISEDEIVVVMPCDQYTEPAYFEIVKDMSISVSRGYADLVLMGIEPDEPSTRYGYIVPNKANAFFVEMFSEKPDLVKAKDLIKKGALWNAGVFAFKLGWLNKISRTYLNWNSFSELRDKFELLPRNSFDYEVVEKTNSIGVIPFSGLWKDLGTWDAITNELSESVYGKSLLSKCSSTSVINELNIPIVCHGVSNIIIAASYDGILVSDKSKSSDIKSLVEDVGGRPMYEERCWGNYKVVDLTEFPDGYKSLTKQIMLKENASLSYQRHNFRNEMWVFINGEGEILLNDERKFIKRGDIVHIPATQFHALKAITPISFIEVQTGYDLNENDIENAPYNW